MHNPWHTNDIRCVKQKYIIKALFACLIAYTAQAQPVIAFEPAGAMNLQYGFSCKGTLEIGDWPPTVHIALGSGVGSNFITSELYPTINTEVLIYTRRFGTGKPILKQNWFTVDWVIGLTLTGGLKNVLTEPREPRLANRYAPLYYFANFSYPALINPYRHSVSVGTNIIFSTSRTLQRVGFLGLHPVDELNICYYNDGGPPMDFLRLGDLQDRYYTGGGVISYRNPSHTIVQLIEAGYHKFTGYSKASYQVAKRLNMAFVDYSDEDQLAFNRSMWSLNITGNGWGVQAREYNRTSWDMQHKIHWGGFSPFHQVPHKREFTISGQYFYAQSNLSLR
jgi:hypothetical protein